jgi:hypothetical protein
MKRENNKEGQPPTELTPNELLADAFVADYLVRAYNQTTAKKDTEILFDDLINPLFKYYLDEDKTHKSIGKKDISDAVKRKLKSALGLEEEYDYILIQSNVKTWIDEHNMAENGSPTEQKVAEHQIYERQTRLEKRLAKQGQTVESYLKKILEVKKA